MYIMHLLFVNKAQRIWVPILTMSLLPFWALNKSVALLSMQGQNVKYLFCASFSLFIALLDTKTTSVMFQSKS